MPQVFKRNFYKNKPQGFEQVPVILEKEMATHSSILAWRIPWMGGLPSMGPQSQTGVSG